MKNFWAGIKNFFVKIFAKQAIEESGEVMADGLRKMATERPKLFKVLVVAGYAAAKTYGPELVASTATDLDDAALDEFLEAVVTVATENGIDLSTIDPEEVELKEVTE